MNKGKLVSLPELRQAQQVVSDFNEILGLLDSIQEKLYNYSHYKVINTLIKAVDLTKEELKLRQDIYKKKLGDLNNESDN